MLYAVLGQMAVEVVHLGIVRRVVPAATDGSYRDDMREVGSWRASHDRQAEVFSCNHFSTTSPALDLKSSKSRVYRH